MGMGKPMPFLLEEKMKTIEERIERLNKIEEKGEKTCQLM